MHDPKCVAHEIKWPKFLLPKKKRDYPPRILTIWHNDPETVESITGIIKK